MSTRAASRHGMRLNPYTIGAILAQIGSFITTYAFFAAVMPTADGRLVFGISVSVEYLLTLGKGLLFNTSNRDDAVGWASAGFDTLLNAGGLWPYTTRLAATPTAVMLTQTLGLEGGMSSIAALILALVFGFWLAIAPHRLWRAGKRGESE